MKLPRLMIKLISLLPTPILLFISNVLPIYFINQLELNYQLKVLLPFFGAAGALFILGAIIIFKLKPSRLKSGLMWFYYISGPALLSFNLSREIHALRMDSPASAIIFLCVFIVGLIVCTYRVNYRKIEGLLAFFGLLLSIQICYSIFDNLHFHEENVSPVRFESGRVNERKNLPNIYHLILDGYQTDFFDMQLCNSLENDLKNFNYYPNATALYDNTVFSVPSVFIGEKLRLNETELDYQNRAFNGKESFLINLKKAGYSTIAITRKFFEFDFDNFDQTIVHSQNIKQVSIDNSDAFIALWIYRVFPNYISKILAENNIFIDKNIYGNLENKTFLADSATQESMYSFSNYLSRERLLPKSGRYTFIHLMLPHDPYIYNAECIDVGKSSVQEQSKCATKLLLLLIEELKKLDRYDNSLIIVHGDHGSLYQKNNNEKWVRTKKRSHRSLLLIKPANTEQNMNFNRIISDVSIINISPGLKQFAMEQTDDNVIPWWRDKEKEIQSQQNRYFYRVYRHKYLLKRYLISPNDELLYQNDVKIASISNSQSKEDFNSIFSANSNIEAEEGLLSASTEIRTDLPDTNGSYVTFGSKSYKIELKENSKISIRIRAIAPNGNSNSTTFSINNSPRRVWHLKVSKNWKWYQYDNTFELKKGVHKITFFYREPIYMDQIEIIAAPIQAKHI